MRWIVYALCFRFPSWWELYITSKIRKFHICSDSSEYASFSVASPNYQNSLHHRITRKRWQSAHMRCESYQRRKFLSLNPRSDVHRHRVTAADEMWFGEIFWGTRMTETNNFQVNRLIGLQAFERRKHQKSPRERAGGAKYYLEKRDKSGIMRWEGH